MPPQPPSIDATLLQEARSLIPPPLMYGQFRPEVGTFVEYEVTSKQGKALVRAAVVGRSVRPSGEPLYQVEFIYSNVKPRTMVVLWILGDERPMVDRLALAVDDQTPISMPVDLYLDLPELRGAQTREAQAQVKAGPFASKGMQRSYKATTGATADVLTTDKVPLFGVETVRSGQDTWVARKTGTGVGPELNTVPLSVPRLPRMTE
jgi:hypothetical protein